MDQIEAQMTPEKIEALHRARAVFKNIEERIAVGENKVHIDASLSHLSRLLPTLNLVRAKESYDEFARVSPDGTVDSVTIYHEDAEDGGDYADWFKLMPGEEGAYQGHYLRFSGEWRLEDDSFGAQIGEVTTDPPVTDTPEGRDFGGFQIRDTRKLWTFEQDGSVLYEDFQKEENQLVRGSEAPIRVFNVDPRDLTVQ